MNEATTYDHLVVNGSWYVRGVGLGPTHSFPWCSISFSEYADVEDSSNKFVKRLEQQINEVKVK